MPASGLSETACFALLDDCNASADMPSSRLYSGHIASLTCRNAREFGMRLKDMRSALTGGMHAVGVFTYELGERLQGIADDAGDSSKPLATILLFKECRRLSSAQVETWLAQQTSDHSAISDEARAGIANVHADIAESAFQDSIEKIHAYIEAGDTYQVNFTYRLHFDVYGSAAGLYARLRKRQPVPYGALISLPDGQTVLSLSPELFVRHENGCLTACPMKGTAPATGNASQDLERSAALSEDPKNRAENVMIVDLLRNDLGRIAELGSVHVPELFDVKRHGGVLQMTSTINAKLRAQVDLAELFNAIYPCGSITGAPKHRTMQIIDELEHAPRGLYTGAIGWFEPHDAGHAIGDFCMSVPIRTLVLDPQRDDGIRHGEMGVGAGIVHDSDAMSEYAECRLKARFLTGLPPDFELFETMHATRDAGCRHLELHLQRLCSSASYFGFHYDDRMTRDALTEACTKLLPGTSYRLRLSLNHEGDCAIQTGPLAPWASPAKILLASEPTRSEDIFLRHKTTARERYDLAWRTAESQGAFDMLFCNARGELTEGARSSIFIKLQGRWYTPPLASGLLPGVMRRVLLADPAWNASERRLTLEDLRNAEEVVVCNALRGVLPAQVVWPDAPADTSAYSGFRG
ncbi:aminodeoxychorismate synthase component I [Oxalobacteraceae bacterium R-40]|uniref:Aminodeoxychorismate synthase component I n=1 Tax=Keguizhuia sedimenti TaxID=3064264 RepID=A0ABU1BP08_9BURK|nr:aminodeoxychorismate synthase component I [Oxalobacteraceae bacterium R-40]